MNFFYKPQIFNDRWMPVSWDGDIPEQKALSNDDIEALAAKFNVPYAHLKAVVDVESAGSGFLTEEPKPARPKVLFERHIFYQLTPKPVSRTRPDLAGPTWDKKYYVGGSDEWKRLHQAAWFDEENALKSASWGLGQVLGANYKKAGASSIRDFVAEEFTGETMQLTHMLNFIKNSGIMDELRVGDWAGFARIYNGGSYKVNKYDAKLRVAAAKYR